MQEKPSDDRIIFKIISFIIILMVIIIVWLQLATKTSIVSPIQLLHENENKYGQCPDCSNDNLHQTENTFKCMKCGWYKFRW